MSVKSSAQKKIIDVRMGSVTREFYVYARAYGFCDLPPPVSQQLPRRDQLLHRSCGRKRAAVDDRTFSIGSLINLAHGGLAQNGKVTRDLFQVLGTPGFFLAEIGAACHDDQMLSCSPCVRLRNMLTYLSGRRPQARIIDCCHGGYLRAGKPVCRGPLDAEWLDIIKALLE
jgi:hypothetical protein